MNTCKGKHRRLGVGYHATMETWIDDYNPTPAVRARLAELNTEWAAIDRRLEAEPTSDERGTMLGRIDEIEYEIDEAVRGRSQAQREGPSTQAPDPYSSS